MWCDRTVAEPAPWTRAASTKSRSRRTTAWPYVTRAMGAQNTAASPTINDSSPRPRMVEMAATSSSPGMARPRSVKRISTPATCPLLAAAAPPARPPRWRWPPPRVPPASSGHRRTSPAPAGRGPGGRCPGGVPRHPRPAARRPASGPRLLERGVPGESSRYSTTSSTSASSRPIPMRRPHGCGRDVFAGASAGPITGRSPSDGGRRTLPRPATRSAVRRCGRRRPPGAAGCEGTGREGPRQRRGLALDGQSVRPGEHHAPTMPTVPPDTVTRVLQHRPARPELHDATGIHRRHAVGHAFAAAAGRG